MTEFSYNAYYWLKLRFTPTFTGVYLVFEALAVVTATVLIFSYSLSVGHALSLSIGPLVFIAVLLVSSRNRQVYDERIVLNQSTETLILATIVSIFSVSIPSIVVGFDVLLVNLFVGLAVLGGYAYIIQLRGQKYKQSRRFYTPSHSRSEPFWYTASVAFEQGIAHYEKRQYHRSYYYLKRAVSLYQNREKNAQREHHRRIAYHLQLAADALLKNIVQGGDNNSTGQFDAHLADAVEATYYIWCDVCNQVKPIGKSHQVLDKFGFEASIICGRCYYERQYGPGRTKQRTSQTDETTTDQATDSKSKSTESTSSTESAEYDISVKQACEVLGVSRGFNEEHIIEAFRKRVKETHPDMGGSTEAFKRVKDARERLEDETE